MDRRRGIPGSKREEVSRPGEPAEPAKRTIRTTRHVEQQIAGHPSVSARISDLSRRWAGVVRELAPARSATWWGVVMGAFKPELGLAVGVGEDPVWETLVVFQHLYGEEVRAKYRVDLDEVIALRESAPALRYVLADLAERWWLCPAEMTAQQRMEALGIAGRVPRQASSGR